MTVDAFAFPGPEKGSCGCSCGLYGTLRARAWKSNGLRCVRGCKCRQCTGARSRTRGDSEARKMRLKLKLGGPRTRHEQLWGGNVRVEAKAGARDAGPVITRYMACRSQAEKDKAIGDTRPFAALFSFNGCQVAVLTVADLARILEAI